MYFQIIYNALREPMRRALEQLIMEQQIKAKATFPPFAQQLIDRGKLEGELKGELEGELKGRRATLVRLMARAGIELSEEQRARIETCADTAVLDRWLDNLLGAKTAADVLT